MTPLTDTELLDALDSLPLAYGGWKVRESSTGRGWRLMTTSETPNYPTAREAIEAFVRERNAKA